MQRSREAILSSLQTLMSELIEIERALTASQNRDYGPTRGEHPEAAGAARPKRPRRQRPA